MVACAKTLAVQMNLSNVKMELKLHDITIDFVFFVLFSKKHFSAENKRINSIYAMFTPLTCVAVNHKGSVSMRLKWLQLNKMFIWQILNKTDYFCISGRSKYLTQNLKSYIRIKAKS